MKKFLNGFLAVLVTLALAIGGAGLIGGSSSSGGVCAYNSASFADYLTKQSGGDDSYHGSGSSLSINNPEGLGTTTLFSGTSIDAQGTVADKDINFNIYGDDREESGTTSLTVQSPKYALVANLGNITPGAKLNTGGQYILVDNVNLNDIKVVTEVSIPSTHPDDAFLFGARAQLGTAAANAFSFVGEESTGNFRSDYGKNGSDFIRTPDNFPYGTDEKNAFVTIIKENNSPTIISNGSTNTSIPAVSGGTIAANTIGKFAIFDAYLTGTNKVDTRYAPAKMTYFDIYQGGVLAHHLVAVPKGSMIYSTTPAPSNCMYDTITEIYYGNQGSDDFGIEEVDSDQNTTTTNIDLSSLNLKGEKIYGDDYTYIDGNGQKWLADYLEVNKQEGYVRLHRNIGDTSVSDVNEDLASSLLDIATLDDLTRLGNTSGLWMDGAVGPIVNYHVSVSGDAEISGNDTINVLDFDKTITVNYTGDDSSISYAGWSFGTISNFYIKLVDSSNNTTITAHDIFLGKNSSAYYDLGFASQATASTDDSGDFDLSFGINFVGGGVSTYTVDVAAAQSSNGDISDILIGGISTPSTSVFSNTSSVSVEVKYNDTLYVFGGFTIEGCSLADGSSLENTKIVIVPTGNVIISYKITPHKYGVQIAAKTTQNENLDPENMQATPYGSQVSYNNVEPDTISINDLSVTHNWFDDSDESLYVFDHFECNGIPVSNQITIDQNTLTKNERLDDNFIVYAVYQKKYIVNVTFDCPDSSGKYTSNFNLLIGNGTDSLQYPDLTSAFDGLAVNEGDSIVVEITPDKRYAFDTLDGDNGEGQVINTGGTVYVFLSTSHSFDLTVNLVNASIRVDFALNITDNDSREIVGVPDYISDGTAANYTTVSVDGGSQNLSVNDTTLNMFNYRANGFGIWNFTTEKYDPLVNGVLSAGMDNFFENYVDDNGNARVCLYVIKQYLVVLSTPGFTQDDSGMTFTNSDLGSYTAQFTGGEYKSLGNGSFMVDVGTTVTLTDTIGKYGDFSGYAGLFEGEDASFIVNGARSVSIDIASTKTPAWVTPTIIGGGALVVLLILLTMLMLLRSSKLKKQKLAREAEIRDMKRKFNISDEIEKLRSGDFASIPQSGTKTSTKSSK